MSQNTRAASLPNFSQFAKKKSILLARIFAKEYKSGKNYEIGKKIRKGTKCDVLEDSIVEAC